MCQEFLTTLDITHMKIFFNLANNNYFTNSKISVYSDVEALVKTVF